MVAGIRVWWIFAFFAAFSVVRFVIGSLRTMQRAGDMAAAAQELGLTFTPWTNDSNAIPKVGTELFCKHSTGGFHNFMAGNFGRLETQVFDYSYSSGNAQNSSTAVQTVAVYTQNVDLPLFTLQPSSLALKILDTLQHQKVDLDYPPGVSHHYAVHGSDATGIKALFNGSLISFVEGLDRSKGWHIEGAGKTLVMYRYNNRIKPAQLREFLQETSSIAQTFLSLSGTRRAYSSAAL